MGEPLDAERRLELVSAFARGIICEFDAGCRYRDVWATDEGLLAMPAEALIGRTIAEALGEEVGRPLMDATARVYATGTPETHEYALDLPDPLGRRVFQAEIVSIRADRAAALIRDVTEEKAIERKLAEAERLAGLGLLAAGIGHEINNPLMVIQQTARLANERLRGPVEPLQAMMAAILDAAQRMQAIVSDLRLFRRESDDSRYPVDVHAALGKALDMTQRQIKQCAQLECDLGAVPLISGSDGKLSQIFVNLLVNAAQSIDEEARAVPSIRVRTLTDAEGWAVIEICDTGRGIAAEQLGRVFDPFFTTKREGMGLGLSICNGIVKSWGGRIGVTSEMGCGTTFRLALPPHGAGTPSEPIARPAAPSARPPSARMRLLVVDDEPALLRVLALALGDDHDVVTAQGCDPAVRIVTSDTRFDAVLCDLMMPLGDGIVFYEHLARVAPHLQPRVVFMTGGAFTPRTRRFLESVSNKILEKPFGPDAVAEVLVELAPRIDAADARS